MAYRISLIFTILLTLAAFFTLLGWVGRMTTQGISFPWLPLGLLLAAGLNCTFRKRVIMR